MSAAVSPRRLPFVWAWLVLVAGALTIGTRADARSPLSPWSLDLEDHPGLLSADVTAIDGDDRGRIWFATAEGGASRLDPRTGEWRTFADAATLGGTVVMDVRVAGDGHVWFGTLDLGIVRYAPDTGVWTRDWGERGPTCNGHEIIEARRGQIWIMCFGGDLHRYRPDADRWEQVGDDEWEPLRHVEDIAEVFVRVTLAAETRYPIYNSGGESLSLGQLAALVSDVLPDAEIKFEAEEGGREGSGLYRMDNSRLIEEFEVEYAPFAQRIRETIDEVRGGGP